MKEKEESNWYAKIVEWYLSSAFRLSSRYPSIFCQILCIILILSLNMPWVYESLRCINFCWKTNLNTFLSHPQRRSEFKRRSVQFSRLGIESHVYRDCRAALVARFLIAASSRRLPQHTFLSSSQFSSVQLCSPEINSTRIFFSTLNVCCTFSLFHSGEEESEAALHDDNVCCVSPSSVGWWDPNETDGKIFFSVD